MNRQVTSLAVAGAVAVAAAGSAARSPTQATQAATVTAKESGTDLFVKSDVRRARRGTDLLDAYFQSPVAGRRQGRQRVPLDVVIATLPDPLDSHLDYEFDAELAAIRQAFEASGYVIDRFWLPWPIDREEGEVAARLNRIDTGSYHRSFPGVILFRKADGTSLRLLYIVGEVPTNGMHIAAFNAALAGRTAALADLRVSREGGTLRIIGPAFTGGAPALREALLRIRTSPSGTTPLRRRRGNPLNSGDDYIFVISGSATGNAVKGIVEADTLAWPRVRFNATVHSDTVIGLVERNVLCTRLHIKGNEIALLRESSTQYGALQRDTASRSDDCSSGMLEIPFPANISNLRSEYARAPAGLQGDRTPGSRISLNLQDPSGAMEQPQMMSLLTPAIVDALLDQVSQTLSGHHIRAVGIIATDARDKLFLAEQLRRRMKDLTLFTRESNILLVRRDVNIALRGMLVFATYPLQLDAQRWDSSGVGHRRYAFASDWAQGVFNATRLHLEARPHLAEYGVHDMGDASLYCDREGIRTRTHGIENLIPPVWVLAVGRGGFFPITACRTGNDNNLMALGRVFRSEPVSDSQQSNTWLTCVVLYALVIMLTAVELRQFLAERPDPPDKRGDHVMREIDWRLLIMQRHLYALLRVIASATIVAALGTGIAHRLGTEVGARLPLMVAAVIALIVVISLAAVHMVDAFRAWLETLRAIRTSSSLVEHRSRIWNVSDAWGRAAIFVVACWFVFNAASYVADIRALELTSPLRQEFLMHRAGVLDGGFSPAMMVALIGGMFFLWCSWHLSRIHLLLASPSAFEWASVIESDGRSLNVPGPVIARWHQSMRAVRTHLVMLVPDVTSMALFLLLLLLAIGLARKMLISYEALLVPSYKVVIPFTDWEILSGTRFDFIARFGVTSALAATAWALFRAVRIWADLQKTLGKLGRTPLVTAFERLPRRIARLTRLNVLRPHAEALVLSISASQAAHLRRLYAHLTTDERQSLAVGLLQVNVNAHRPLTPRDYLDRLMLQGPQRSHAWLGKPWTDVSETADQISRPSAIQRLFPWIGREEEKIVADAPSRAEEALATRYLIDLVEERHRDEPDEEEIAKLLERAGAAGGADTGPRSTSGHIRRSFGTNARLWLRSAEELVAVQAVDYTQWVMHHLRYLTLYIVGSLVIVTEMLASYVLQPSSTLWVMLILLVLIAVVTLVSIFVQMNRDEVLSRITGTPPGKLTWDVPFITNLAVVGIVPVLTFVGSAVPWLHDILFSWVDPFLRALGKH